MFKQRSFFNSGKSAVDRSSWVAGDINDWTYTISGKTIYLNKYIGSNTSVTVPDYFTQYKSYEINYNGTTSYPGVFNSTTGHNVTDAGIGDITATRMTTMYQMFNNSTNLVNFNSNIPETVINTANCFTSCQNLVDMSNCVFNNAIMDMSNCFINDKSLKYPPIIENALIMYQSFSNQNMKLDHLPNIPDSVTNMASTFYYCNNLTGSIPNIPNSVTNIYYTFYQCYKLTGSIPNIPDSVTNMASTFSSCRNLTGSIPNIPDSVTNMANTFSYCSNLTGSIPNIPDSVTNMASTFSYCSNLTGSIPNIPDSVTNMAYTFYYCNNLTGSIPNIPDSVTNMASTFTNCSNLTGSIPNIPDSVTNMAYTFNYCYKLTGSIPNIPNSVTNIYYTFYQCYKLTGSIPNIPNSVTNISGTFSYCYNLTGSIPNIPDSVTNMDNTFYQCYKLTGSIPNIPNSVTTISGTFTNCSNLTGSIPNIPDSVTNMASTFYYCNNLTGSIPNIPNSVTNMYQTFWFCSNLTGISNIPDYVTSMYKTFAYCYNLTGNFYIFSLNVSNCYQLFNGTTLEKNIYVSFTYPNGVNTVTYNSIQSLNGQNGITLYDCSDLYKNDANWIYRITEEGYAKPVKWIGSTSERNFTFEPTFDTYAVTSPLDYIRALNSSSIYPNYIQNITVNGEFNSVYNTSFINTFANNYYGTLYQNPNLKSITGDLFNNCVSLCNTFYNCYNLTGSIPNIPDSVTNMASTFSYCYNLTGSIPNIPDSVTNMSYTFQGCYNLTGSIPNIPDSVTNMASTFSYCSNLTGSIPNIPDSVTNMANTFYQCYNLTGSIPNIPDSVTNMAYTFNYCYNLTGSIPNIPDSVTNMANTFYYCTNLTGSIPNIPNSVTDMYYTFSSCSNLTGSIPNIPNSVTNMASTFFSCSNLTGSIPNIPNSVTTISGTFTNCSNLTGSIPNIPDSVTNMDNTFQLCSGLTLLPERIGNNVQLMRATFNSCYKLTGTTNIYAKHIENVYYCFYGTSLDKNLYIPYHYENGMYTTTYNVFSYYYGHNENGVHLFPLDTQIHIVKPSNDYTVLVDGVQINSDVAYTIADTINYKVYNPNYLPVSSTMSNLETKSEYTLDISTLSMSNTGGYTLQVNTTDSTTRTEYSYDGYTVISNSVYVEQNTVVDLNILDTNDNITFSDSIEVTEDISKTLYSVYVHPSIEKASYKIEYIVNGKTYTLNKYFAYTNDKVTYNLYMDNNILLKSDTLTITGDVDLEIEVYSVLTQLSDSSIDEDDYLVKYTIPYAEFGCTNFNTSRSYYKAYNIYDINDMYFLVGCYNTILTSKDYGSTWSCSLSSTSNYALFALAYGNGKYVSVGCSSQYYYNDDFVPSNTSALGYISTDGTTWTQITDSNFTGAGYADIIYANNMFVAVGSQGRIATSTDGTTWTKYTVVGTGTGYTSSSYIKYNKIIYANNMFVAVGYCYYNGNSASQPAISAYSTDGVNWVFNIVNGSDRGLYSIAYDDAHNAFFVGGESSSIFKSEDGINWSQISVGSVQGNSYKYQDASYGNGIVVFICNYSSSNLPRITTITDGNTCTNVITSSTDCDYNRIIYHNGAFYITKNRSIIKSIDGINWSEFISSSDTLSSYNLQPILVNDKNLIAGYYNSPSYILNKKLYSLTTVNPAYVLAPSTDITTDVYLNNLLVSNTTNTITENTVQTIDLYTVQITPVDDNLESYTITYKIGDSKLKATSIQVGENTEVDYSIVATLTTGSKKAYSSSVTVSNADVIQTVDINSVEELTYEEVDLSSPFNASTYASFTLDNFVDGTNFVVSGSNIQSGSKSYNVNNGSSYGYIKFTTPDTETTLSIICYVSSESGWDYAGIYVGTALYSATRDQIQNKTTKTGDTGTWLYSASGTGSSSTYIMTLSASTEYYLQFYYSKDSSGNTGSDRFFISNIKFTAVPV